MTTLTDPEELDAVAQPRRVPVLASVTVAALDVDRLTAVIRAHYATGRHGFSDHACATAIAIEYAALAAEGGPA